MLVSTYYYNRDVKHRTMEITDHTRKKKYGSSMLLSTQTTTTKATTTARFTNYTHRKIYSYKKKKVVFTIYIIMYERIEYTHVYYKLIHTCTTDTHTVDVP